MSDHHDPAERADLTPKTIPLTRSRQLRSEDMDHLSDEALAGIRADVAKRLSAREAAAHFRAVSDVANEQSSRREAARSAPDASIAQPKSRPLVRPEIPRIDQHLSQLSLGHHMLQPHRELSVQVRSTAMTTHAPVSETLPETSAGHGDALTMRLPSAWYAKPADVSEGLSAEQRSQLIRASAAVCITTAAGMLIWLGAASMPTSPPPNFAASIAPHIDVSVSPAGALEPTKAIAAPAPEKIDHPARNLVTTAQILAVAERFVATGDILAARAMLSETAGAGEPRALFALAETYDPNLLASWNARSAEASTAYARMLYEAARRGGITEAQTRLDALR